jgi:hypothetical protein
MPHPETEPHFERGYYEQVVSLLRAMNLKASVFTNGMVSGVQVYLENARAVVWSNHDNWAMTLVDERGVPKIHKSEIKADAPVESVASMIAYTDYDAIEAQDDYAGYPDPT